MCPRGRGEGRAQGARGTKASLVNVTCWAAMLSKRVTAESGALTDGATGSPGVTGESIGSEMFNGTRRGV